MAWRRRRSLGEEFNSRPSVGIRSLVAFIESEDAVGVETSQCRARNSGLVCLGVRQSTYPLNISSGIRARCRSVPCVLTLHQPWLGSFADRPIRPNKTIAPKKDIFKVTRAGCGVYILPLENDG